MLKSIEEPYVKVKLAPGFKEKLRECCAGVEDVPDGAREVLSGRGECLRLEDLKWCRLQGMKGIWELLEESELKLPEPGVVPRNAALEARVKKLRAQQDENDYKEMTRNVDNARGRVPQEDSIAYQVSQMNRQLIAVGQFILSISAGFAFGFLGLEFFIGGMETESRILSGVGCASIVAVAELYFLVKHLDPPPPCNSKRD